MMWARTDVRSGPSGPSNWKWSASKGTSSTSSGNLTTCYFASVVLESPDPPN